MSEEKDRRKSMLILREDFFDKTVGREDYKRRNDRTVMSMPPNNESKSKHRKEEDEEER